MYASVGGFSAVDYGSPLLGVFAVPGSAVRLSLRRETAPLHVAVAAAWNNEVEQLILGQCWGHAYRAVRGATTTSYHALGNAMDFNSLVHPLGVRGTFSAAKVAAGHRVLGRFTYNGVRLYRWGLDYSGRVDEMHVELIADRATALRAVAALQSPPKAGPLYPKWPLPAGEWFGVGPVTHAHSGTRPADLGSIKAIQRAANKISGSSLVLDGKYGAGTEAAVVDVQTRKHWTPHGRVGPQTWAGLFR